MAIDKAELGWEYTEPEKIKEQVEDKFSKFNVVHDDHYKKWQKLEKLPLLNEGRYIMCSDGETVNLGSFTNVFKKDIEHLPIEEQVQLMKRKKAFERIRGKANAHKREAFGRDAQGTGAKLVIRNQIDYLASHHKDEILELFGRMFSPKEVFKFIIEELKVPVDLASIVEFRSEHIEIITKKLEEFKRDFSDMRLSHKKGRLEELVWLFQRSKDLLRASGRASDRDFLLKVLEQIRKETEGDTLRIEGNLDLKVEGNINIHLKTEVLQTIQLSQIVVGKVASRMGILPSNIIKNLNDSFYSKFNGMISEEDQRTLNAEYQDMSYPSSQAYDFSKIPKYNKEIEEQDKARAQAEVDQRKSNIEIAEKEGFKLVLKKKLEERKTEIIDKEARVKQLELNQEVEKAEVESKKDYEKYERKFKNKKRFTSKDLAQWRDKIKKKD